MIIEYCQGLWKTLFFHWLNEREWKDVNCYPQLFNKYLLFSLRTGKHKTFQEFYRTLQLQNLFTV